MTVRVRPRPEGKICADCKERKPLSDFHVRSSGRYYSYCKPCAYVRVAASKAKGHQKIKAWIRELRASTPCTDCGTFYPWYVMEFDHCRGTKLFDIANPAHRGRKAVEAEIAKCDIVCANCHRIRTHFRR